MRERRGRGPEPPQGRGSARIPTARPLHQGDHGVPGNKPFDTRSRAFASSAWRATSVASQVEGVGCGEDAGKCILRLLPVPFIKMQIAYGIGGREMIRRVNVRSEKPELFAWRAPSCRCQAHPRARLSAVHRTRREAAATPPDDRRRSGGIASLLRSSAGWCRLDRGARRPHGTPALSERERIPT